MRLNEALRATPNCGWALLQVGVVDRCVMGCQPDTYFSARTSEAVGTQVRARGPLHTSTYSRHGTWVIIIHRGLYIPREI